MQGDLLKNINNHNNVQAGFCRLAHCYEGKKIVVDIWLT